MKTVQTINQMTFEEYRNDVINQINDIIAEMKAEGYSYEEIEEWESQQEIPKNPYYNQY